MGLTVQPSVLEDIGRIKGANDRGLLARFFYSLPTSLVGQRKILPAPIPDAVAATYEENVTALTMSLADWTDPAVLQLSSEAGDVLVAFEERQEPRLRPRGETSPTSGTGPTSWAARPADWPACSTSRPTPPKGTPSRSARTRCGPR